MQFEHCCSLLWVLFECFAQEVLETFTYLSLHVLVKVEIFHLLEGPSSFWTLPHCERKIVKSECVDTQAKCPHVCLPSRIVCCTLTVFEALGSKEFKCTSMLKKRVLPLLVEDLCRAEISQFSITLIIYDNILGLQIAVHDLFVMQIGNCFYDL